jgi:hypothetical protein
MSKMQRVYKIKNSSNKYISAGGIFTYIFNIFSFGRYTYTDTRAGI